MSKLVKRDLNTALNHVRVLMAAPYGITDKMDFIDLKEDIVELISAETDKKEKALMEKQEAVFEDVRGIVAAEVKKATDAGREYKNKESLISALLQDHPALTKINEERNEFWGLPVINKIPFILKPGLEPLPGVATLSTGNGSTQSYRIKPSFDWLVENGFIEVTTKQNNKNGSK